VRNGDKWLKENIDSYYRWAKGHNSLLIITFDESENRTQEVGLTDPGDARVDRRNRIPTILAGAHIKTGNYDHPVTHVNLLHTLEAMYGLELIGEQQRYAQQRGIAGDYILTEVFERDVPPRIPTK
jgi:acid phosphatase